MPLKIVSLNFLQARFFTIVYLIENYRNFGTAILLHKEVRRF